MYLWTFVDTFWPSLLGFLALGLSNYAPMNTVINGFWGNPSTYMAFMLYIFCAALVKNQLANYLAQFLMTRRITENRPWLMTTGFLLTAYLVASLDSMAAVFIIWPVFYAVFKEVGLKKGDKYVSLMLVNSLIMILLCFATDAIKGGSFFLLANLYAIAGANPELLIKPVNFGAFMFFGFIISMAVMLCLVFIMRYVLRADANPLKKLNIDVLLRNKLPPMSWKNKALILILIGYVIIMSLPGALPNDSIVKIFIQDNLFAWPTVMVLCLGIIHHKGEALAEIQQLMAVFPWRPIFLIASAFLLGSAVTTPQTQVAIYAEYILRDMFEGLSFYGLISASIVVAIIITNFSNSIVAGIVLTPVLVALCNVYGFDSSPLLVCFFFVVLVGAATPAASPYAALLFDNGDWITRRDAMRYASIASMVLVIVMILLGIPLAQILF